MSQATAYEQFLLELINAERAQVGAQPLAFDGDLNEAAEWHSQWMINTDTFSHTGSGGSSFTTRIRDAGYQFTGSWTAAENIAWVSLRGASGYSDEVQLLHTNLMNSPGHKANLLNVNFQEVGLGFEVGQYGSFQGAFITEDFAKSGSATFLTGVAFDDQDGDRFYDPGEGLAGLTVTATSSTGAKFTATTEAAGGYDMTLAAGTYTVAFSGANIATTSKQVTIGSLNVKVDLIDPAAPTGTPGDDTLVGTEADDTLSGQGGNDLLRGLGGNDTLLGGDGNDILDGGPDDDQMDGGAGYDLVSFAGATSGVTVDLSIAGVQNTGGAGFDRLVGVEYLLGSAYDDTLKGDGINNVLLSGGGGNDVLYSGRGDDYLIGGAGYDFVSFAGATAGVTVDLSISGEQNTGGAGSDGLVDIEYVIGSAYGDNLKGNGIGNVLLAGGAGNDVLYSGAGDDYLIGGAGYDFASFAGATGGVTVDLSISGTQNIGGAGADHLVEIEYLIGSTFGDTLRGDGINNVLLAGAGGNDVLQGGAGADYLLGGAGADTLTGGAGADGLAGNLGADRFVFANLSDIASGTSRDTIMDFSSVEGDKIDLSGIDANTTIGGNQAFSFIGNAAFGGVAGQLHYIPNGSGGVNVEGDIDGNSSADFSFIIDNILTLTATDFIL